MDRAAFEGELKREGYECREGSIEPNTHREAHAHGFDARLLILEGAITLVIDNQPQAYGPGDSCLVPAGTLHEEQTGESGVRYLVGRRSSSRRQ